MMPLTICGEQTIHVPGTSACDDCDAIRDEVEELKDTVENIHKSVQITLPVADWVNDEQTVEVIGVTATNHVIVTPTPSSIADYNAYCSAQDENELTFTKTGTITSDLEVNVLIINEVLS